MKIKHILSLICAAAMLSVTACRSSEISENGGAGSLTDTSSSESSSTNSEVPVTDDTVTTSPAETTTKPEKTTVTTTTVSQPAVETDETTTTHAETTVVTSLPETAATTEVTSGTKSQETTTDLPEPSPADDAPDDDDIELIIDSDGAITTETDNVTLRVTYIGDDDTVMYWLGAQYRIEKYNGGKWTEFPFAAETPWNAVAYELSYRRNAVFGISLRDDMYKEPFTAGSYRVVKKILGKEFYAGFEVIEPVESGYDVYEENGTEELRIGKIVEDGFICYPIYPLPGKYYVKCDPSKYEDYCVDDQIEVYYDKMEVSREEPENIILYATDIRPTNVTLDPDICYKPVIYLYPEEKTDVSVKVDLNGRLTLTDPEYSDGWNVTAYPDGTIIDKGREYPYLFWEGERDFEFDTSKGFCVSGEDTEKFLSEKLAYLGLNEKETAEFMDFWLPFMKNNPYNVITFAGSDYTDNAGLDISPSPDTVIRVYMVFGVSEEYVEIPGQTLEKAPERNGFTVVEWGGSVK